MGGYQFLDHTADVGIQATGVNLREAFAYAAQGMFAWMADLEAVQEREERRVEVEAADPEGLLVTFLNELNYLFETERFLFRRFQVLELSPEPVEEVSPVGPEPRERWHLGAVGYGEPVDLQQHDLRSQVKAATYHLLRIEQQEGSCQVRVILDI